MGAIRCRHGRRPGIPRWALAAGLGVVAMGGLAGCATRSRRPPPPTVASVDLSRYLGRWYEIAHLPNRFQKDCTATTATYSRRDDGDIRVVNRCRKGSLQGPEKSVDGRAWVVDEATNARLKVRFFWPFTGDYWVLALDPAYQWAMVGTPDRRYLWILSRSPTLPSAVWDELVSRAQTLGYPVEALLRTPQPPA